MSSDPDILPVFDITIADPQWRRVSRLKRRLQLAAHVTLAHLPQGLQGDWTANLLLTDDAAMRRLNYDFRGLRKATNVLSFPQFETSVQLRRAAKLAEQNLGDIAMGYAYVAKEAVRDKKLLIDHITHLTIHGLLHLFGYDHMDDREANRMEKLETKIMASLGLPDPYDDRQG